MRLFKIILMIAVSTAISFSVFNDNKASSKVEAMEREMKEQMQSEFAYLIQPMVIDTVKARENAARMKEMFEIQEQLAERQKSIDEAAKLSDEMSAVAL